MFELQRVGDAYLWLEQESSIQLKAVSPAGDPIELTAAQARALASALATLAGELDRLDANHS